MLSTIAYAAALPQINNELSKLLGPCPLVLFEPDCCEKFDDTGFTCQKLSTCESTPYTVFSSALNK